jgi:carbon monoxide dehydrogenase subunit G
MRLEHRFRIPAGLDDTWALLLDARVVESVLPGLRLDDITADEVAGTVRVDVGDHCVTYRGEAALQELVPDARRLVVEAAGRDAEGGRAASATLAVALEPDGDATTVVLRADLDLAGGGPDDSAEASAVVRRVVDELAGGVAEHFGAARTPPVRLPPHTDDPVHQDWAPTGTAGAGSATPVAAAGSAPPGTAAASTGTVARRREAMPVPAHRAPSPVRRVGAVLTRPATDGTAVWVQRGALAAGALALLAVLIWLLRLLRR